MLVLVFAFFSCLNGGVLGNRIKEDASNFVQIGVRATRRVGKGTAPEHNLAETRSNVKSQADAPSVAHSTAILREDAPPVVSRSDSVGDAKAAVAMNRDAEYGLGTAPVGKQNLAETRSNVESQVDAPSVANSTAILREDAPTILNRSDTVGGAKAAVAMNENAEHGLPTQNIADLNAQEVRASAEEAMRAMKNLEQSLENVSHEHASGEPEEAMRAINKLETSLEHLSHERASLDQPMMARMQKWKAALLETQRYLSSVSSQSTSSSFTIIMIISLVLFVPAIFALAWAVWGVWIKERRYSSFDDGKKGSGRRPASMIMQSGQNSGFFSMFFGSSVPNRNMTNSGLSVLSDSSDGSRKSHSSDPLCQDHVVKGSPDGWKLGFMGGIARTKQDEIITVKKYDASWLDGEEFAVCKFAESDDTPHILVSSGGLPVAYLDLSLTTGAKQSRHIEDRKVTIYRAKADSWGLWDPKSSVPYAVASVNQSKRVTLKYIYKHRVGSTLLQCHADNQDSTTVVNGHNQVVASLTSGPRGSKQISLQPGNSGLSIRANTGEITKVWQGSQCDGLGIRQGWRIHKLDNIAYSPQKLQLDSFGQWTITKPCMVQFEVPVETACDESPQPSSPSFYLDISEGADAALVLCAMLAAAKLQSPQENGKRLAKFDSDCSEIAAAPSVHTMARQNATPKDVINPTDKLASAPDGGMVLNPAG